MLRVPRSATKFGCIPGEDPGTGGIATKPATAPTPAVAAAAPAVEVVNSPDCIAQESVPAIAAPARAVPSEMPPLLSILGEVIVGARPPAPVETPLILLGLKGLP